MAIGAADSGYCGWNFDRDNQPVQSSDGVNDVITTENEEVAYEGQNKTTRGNEKNKDDAATSMLRHKRRQLGYDGNVVFLEDALEFLEIVCDEKEEYDEEVEQIHLLVSAVMDGMENIRNADNDGASTATELATILHKLLRGDSRFQLYIKDNDDDAPTGGTISAICKEYYTDELKGTILQDKPMDQQPYKHEDNDDDASTGGTVNAICKEYYMDEVKGTILQEERTDQHPYEHKRTERAIFLDGRQKEQRKVSNRNKIAIFLNGGKYPKRQINNSE